MLVSTLVTNGKFGSMKKKSGYKKFGAMKTSVLVVSHISSLIFFPALSYGVERWFKSYSNENTFEFYMQEITVCMFKL